MIKLIVNVGGQGWNRTTDTRIFSPLLYRLSYLPPARVIVQSQRAEEALPALRLTVNKFRFVQSLDAYM